MAIDPSIALAVRPVQLPVPQIQSPVDRLAQVLSLRDLMMKGQSGQLDLQTKTLQLQQLQREMEERQRIADYFGKAYGSAGATPADTGAVPAQAAPIQTAPLQMPPVQPTPIGGTVAQTAPATIAPNFGLPATPPAAGAPGAPLSTLATPPAVTPATPATAMPAMAGQDGSGLGAFNVGDLLRIAPTLGPGIAKSYLGLQKDQAEALKTQHEVNAGRASEMEGLGISIRDSADPPSQFVSALTEAGNKGLLPWPTVRQMISDGYDKHKNDVQAFIDKAHNATDQAKIQQTNLEALGTAQKNAAATIGNVTDQASYDQWLPLQDRRVQAMLGPTYHPGLNDAVRTWAVPGAEQPKTQMAQRAADAQMLAPLLAKKDGGAAFQAKLATMSPERAAPFADASTSAEVMKRALEPEQYVNALHQNLQTLTEAEKIRLDREKFNAEFGPGSAESWAAQVYANPDTVKDIPANMRTAALNAFTAKHPGLPFPSPLEGAAKTQETAAQNTLGDVAWIRNALKNPNIANNIGPILGRLQNVEQATGEATGLTGADAQMAQEFRTRMRMMLANEAGAMHARINPKMMDDLAKGSGSITMDPKMLSGALDGVEGSVNNTLNGFERQRFGGQTRPPEARGLVTPVPDNVRQALSGVKTGIHKLSDGSWWIKNQDGSVTQTTAPK